MDSIRPRSLTEYIEALRRHKLAIIIPALVVMIASAIAIKALPNIYESSTFIMVESPQGERYSEKSLPDLSQRLGNIRQQVTSRSRLESVINKFGLFKKQLEKGERLDDLLSDMRGKIDLDVSANQEAVTKAFLLSYRDRDPEIAQKVAAELAEQLIADNVEAMKNIASGETEVLNQRASELSTKLHDLELGNPWLLNLREDAPVIPYPYGGNVSSSNGSRGPSQTRVNIEAERNQTMTVENLKDQQYRLEQQLAEIEKRIAELRPVVEQQKKASPLSGNPAYGALIAQRAQLEGERDNLINRQELTDKHPRVLAVNDKIAAINRQIEELKQQNAGAIVQTQEARDLRQAESERTKVKADLEVARRAVDRQIANPPRPAIVSTGGSSTVASTPATRDPNSARIAQDYLGLKADYKEVISKKQDAELKEKTIGSSKVEQYRVLDQANLPQLPVAPNRRLLMGIAIVLGLAAGIGFAMILEFRRFSSLQDVKDVEYFTKLPMLAAIPRTLTAKERDLENRQNSRRLAMGAALAVVATFALTGFFIFTNLFASIIKK
jgi:succinoglycan biosynthesis transport protein ExoP